MTKRKIETIDLFTLKSILVKDSISLLQDLLESNKKPVLQVKFDATHSGRLTNRRVYPGRHMKNSVNSFLEPYPKPILKHHNDESDPIGRIISATYVQLKKGDDFKFDYKNPTEDTGSGFIKLSGNIVDVDAIEKFIDGRYNTVSTRQAFDSMLCSICGKDFFETDSEDEEPCRHFPGRTYTVDKKNFLCYGITGPLRYREVSIVNIPGDDQAQTTGFELIHQDNEEPLTIHCKEEDMLTIFDVSLSDGFKSVQLLETEEYTSVSSEDRKELTGKTIISTSPHFKVKEQKSMESNNKDQDKDLDKQNKSVDDSQNKDKTSSEENTDNKNITDTKTSGDSNKSDDQSNSDTNAMEGVVAPEQGNSGDNDQEDVEDATPKVDKELSAKIARLEKDVKDKEEELTRVRNSLSEKDTELKKALATNLVYTKVFLKKPDVSSVKNSEEMDALITKYSERSIESLKDSITDLAPELINQKGIVKFSAKELLSKSSPDKPVRDGSPVKKEKPQLRPKTKQEVRQETVKRAESFIN